jgi:hypothetical protein
MELYSSISVSTYGSATFMNTFKKKLLGGSETDLERKKAMKNKRLWILLGGLGLVSAAFLLLNFRVAASNTQAEKLIFATDMGDDMPVPMQRRDKISIVLVGEGPLVGALQKALTEEMDNAGMGEIEFLQELEPGYKHPVLVVRVGNPGPIWTPFFAMSQFSVHAGYASDGDSTFMEVAETTHTSVAKKDAANMYAELEVNDRSLGLMSRSGYHQFLADYLAQEIVAALKNLYHVQKTFLP